jgi:uncharacterized protein
MRRAAVLERLRAERENLRGEYGVESLALFGSVARDEAGPDSDVDVLVEFGRPITLFDLVAVQQHLERCLGVRRVDSFPATACIPRSGPIFSGRRSVSIDRRWQVRIEHILDATLGALSGLGGFSLLARPTVARYRTRPWGGRDAWNSLSGARDDRGRGAAM